MTSLIGTGLNSGQKVLIVEDEADVRDLVAVHLKRAGHSVTAVNSVEEARGAFAAIDSEDGSSGFDVCILDWMLPGSSGVEFARELRKKYERSALAVLMITAKSEPQDIVEGLDAGADDYLTKPFEPSVLVARVRALTRRLKPADFAGATSEQRLDGGTDRSSENSTARVPFQVIRLGGLSLFPETYEVKCEDEPISLTPSEFKLLMALAKSQGRVLTRDSLISQVQGDGVSVVGRTVDTHVFGLRKKLGPCADVIETVRGVGYRVKPELEA